MGHFPSNTFERIIDLENIKGAYFDLALKFDRESKSNRYRGIDGTNLSTLDFISEETFESVRSEMLSFTPISPAYAGYIPKKNGKKRTIHVYPIRERIKAEAIYRVLMPLFDAYFSPYLFSYRSSHPSYYAARSVVRRYKRHHGENFVLVTDISDYADTIDHDILTEKIRGLGIDEGTRRLLGLFIKTDVIQQGVLVKRPRGVLTGTPLYAILSNLYMDEFDKWAGKTASLYRRVGDDIIAMDKDRAKIERIHARLSDTVDSLRLRLNADKGKMIRDTEEFKFLGYSFREGRVGFDESSQKKALASWERSLFQRRTRSEKTKARHLRSMAQSGTGN
jgi:retron-type reverse transcriptase